MCVYVFQFLLILLAKLITSSCNVFVQVVYVLESLRHLLQHLKVKSIIAPELADLIANLYKYCCLSVWSFALFSCFSFPPPPAHLIFSPVVRCPIGAENPPCLNFVISPFLNETGRLYLKFGKNWPWGRKDLALCSITRKYYCNKTNKFLKTFFLPFSYSFIRKKYILITEKIQYKKYKRKK